MKMNAIMVLIRKELFQGGTPSKYALSRCGPGFILYLLNNMKPLT